MTSVVTMAPTAVPTIVPMEPEVTFDKSYLSMFF